MCKCPVESVTGQLVFSDQDCRYYWRVNLLDTESAWPSWFAGLDARFLSTPNPLLVMAAPGDRLDTALTRAAMQGKFQLALVPGSGHCIQEDQPVLLADILNRHIQRVRAVSGPRGGPVVVSQSR
jgi:pimeloyl-ACP methyl ester carboxylesterase